MVPVIVMVANYLRKMVGSCRVFSEIRGLFGKFYFFKWAMSFGTTS